MFQRSFELEAVFKRLLDAIATANPAAFRTVLSGSAELLAIGPAEGWLHGMEAAEVFAAQVSAAPEMSNDYLEIEAYESGSTGWAAAQGTFTLSDGTKRGSRVTAVFYLDEGAWRVVQWHASRPATNMEAYGVELPENLGQLIHSLDGSLEDMLAVRFKSSTVTLVVTDIEGSTDRGVEFGDVVWADAVDKHFSDLARIATDHDGVVVKTMGDGALIAFDSAVGGTRAALDIQRVVRENKFGVGFHVRVGVHTGDAITKASDYFGYTVNKTARIASAAKGGQTLISEVVRGLIGGDSEFDFGEPLDLTLKGLPGPHIAYPLVTPPAERDRT